MIGKIHSIDTFSTLDGPGIRIVVFMQGCHLRCRYCQNPDTWDPHAHTAREYTAEAIMQIINRGLPYFQSSGGGVTFSGGEPLLQAEFVKEVFSHCRRSNIHTALDTSLYVSPETVLDIIPLTDLFLADIKQMDDEKSLSLTGRSNRNNLDNLKLINERQIEIWIRYVIVPGYTDAEKDLIHMAEFVFGLDSVTRVDLLPYHSLGSHKWKLLGLSYDLEETEPPSREHMQALKTLVEVRSNKPVFI